MEEATEGGGVDKGVDNNDWVGVIRPRRGVCKEGVGEGSSSMSNVDVGGGRTTDVTMRPSTT